MSHKKSYVALDVGEKRIGVAVGDSGVRIAVPFTAIETDGREVENIARIVLNEKADVVVVGFPRNQSGEATAQTAYVEAFAKKLANIAPNLVFQDE
ncbi:MAG TPA: Holliday junction resolvase RuvX, partial [Candidatus Saccharimonadales bacterium]|nr:Holliday junction resolvase RuvX [Candidatus Saccharimonadales bacterium]